LSVQVFMNKTLPALPGKAGALPPGTFEIRARPRTAASAQATEGAEHLGFWERSPWGEIIEDRSSQITYSAA